MTGLIPRSFIDEVLNKTDIVELIDIYIPLKKRGHNYIACCPFHNEKTPSFNVSAKKQFYHCFGCSASGNAISFVMKYINKDFPGAIETLAERLSLTVPHEGRQEKSKRSPHLTTLLQNVAQFYQHTLQTSSHMAREYLQKRGLSADVIRLFALGYAPDSWHALETQFKNQQAELIESGMLIQKDDLKTYDRYRQRLMFPIHNKHGKVIGFGGRVIDNQQQPKYINSPETVLFQKSHELYGLYQLLQCNDRPNNIIVVEGYLDVIALAQYGINNSVATLGTATSSYHIQLLSKYTKELIFCFDGDLAGRKAAWRALESALPHINLGLNINFIFLPEEHDPDSLIRQDGAAGFLNRLKQATPLHTFLLDTITTTIDCGNLAGKSQLIHASKPYLETIGEGPYKQLLIDELARLTRIEAHRINQLLKQKVSDLPQGQTTITRTPLRIAIALLLQHPNLYTICAAYLFPKHLDDKHHVILKTLLQQVAEDPTRNTAVLVELWRSSPFFDIIVKLATWDHQVPEHKLVNEFIDTICFLGKQYHERKIKELISKARSPGGLTAEDRLQLQTMLKKRHMSMVSIDNS